MVGWHHQFNEHELEQTLGDCEGQGGLACCTPLGRKELGMTEQLNNNNLMCLMVICVFSSERCLFEPFDHFLNMLLVFVKL